VSKIEFFKKEAKTYSLDPKEGLNRKELVFEIRKDNLTGHIIPKRCLCSHKTQYSIIIQGVYRYSDILLVKRKKWKMSSRSMH